MSRQHPDSSISIEVTNGEAVDKRSSKSISNMLPIKEGDDIEQGLSLFKSFSTMFNKGEALLRYSNADEDDVSEEKSNASLNDSSSIGADSSCSRGADVLTSS